MSTPAETMLARLEGIRSFGPSRWMARCPSHTDRTASLSIRECDDGRVLINCFGGCGAADVVAAVGLELSDLFPPREPPASGRGVASGRVPPIDWRGFRDATRTVLTALCLALRDIAAGTVIPEADREWLAAEAERLLALLELGDIRHG